MNRAAPPMPPAPHPRRAIYYWKCDRPAAFHALDGSIHLPDSPRAAQLASALRQALGEDPIGLRSAGTQGNHATFLATLGGREVFIRVEDGPDRDDNMEVEAEVLRRVAALGVPVPAVLGVDATRREVPFAWQVLERIPHPDLNQHLKAGRLDLARVAGEIGGWIARWQSVAGRGFGPFDIAALRQRGELCGYHDTAEAYFRTRLDEHLSFLVARAFLSPAERSEIAGEIERHLPVLAQPADGCLAHKDLALWNILGPADGIAAFIDWSDAIAGDPMDDLSLLGCFHDGTVIAAALAGYVQVRPLPPDHRSRFWLHLLRNLIWKAVIRVGAGYFDRDSGFFLVGAGQRGSDLRSFTRRRLEAALSGLREGNDPGSLI